MTLDPSTTSDLRARLLAVVAADPGISTIGLCREVRVRKADVLAELDRLEREQVLLLKPGPRGAKCWYLAQEPCSCSHTCSRHG